VDIAVGLQKKLFFFNPTFQSDLPSTIHAHYLGKIISSSNRAECINDLARYIVETIDGTVQSLQLLLEQIHLIR
jgi:hypothetical protein